MSEIKTEKYLKDRLYYNDLYDRHTVDRCRQVERLGLKDDEPLVYKGKKLTKKESAKFRGSATEYLLFFEKGERWLKKEGRIREWIDRDREMDELYESAQPMDNVTCLTCRSVMEVDTKTLYSEGIDAKERVLFMYKCPRDHFPMRSFFNDGEEWGPKRDACPKCSAELKVRMKDTKTKFITTFTCSKCDYHKVDETSRLSAKQEKEDKDFEKDRKRFCLTEEEGKKYVEEKGRLEQMARLVDEWKAEEKDKDLYDAVDKIKKLTFVQLKNLLSPILEKAQYVDLEFGDPDIGKDVQIVFIVHDSSDARQDLASQADLKKLVKKALENTNWRLMTEGVSYKLGILRGRLRGFESKEDLLELVKRRK